MTDTDIDAQYCAVAVFYAIAAGLDDHGYAEWARDAAERYRVAHDGPTMPHKVTRQRGTLARLPDRPAVDVAVWDAPTVDDLPTF